MPRLGFGIVGCGNIGPVHAAAIAAIRNARLVGVADVVEASAQALAKKYGATPYADYREMLQRKDLDAVCLCVPTGLRVEIARACAKAGKHIMAEKPLEVSTRRIDRIIRAADQAGVKLGCIFQSRFAAGSRNIRQALEEGRFGRPVLGDAYIKWHRSAKYYASGAWRGTRKLDGGGALMNQGIHQIDLLLWFMGNVEWVQAETRLVGHEGLEVEDLGCALLGFENGALGVIEGSTAIWPGHPARVEVHGTEGSAVLEDGEITFWQFKNRKRSDARIQAAIGKEAELGSGAGDPLSHLTSEGHRRNIQDFVEAVLEDRAPLVDGREGRRSVALIEAIYKSAASGKRVRL